MADWATFFKAFSTVRVRACRTSVQKVRRRTYFAKGLKYLGATQQAAYVHSNHKHTLAAQLHLRYSRLIWHKIIE